MAKPAKSDKSSKVGTAAKVITAGAMLAVKYGPQAKLAWEKGGKKATLAAAKRARSMTARRKSLIHAATLVDGSILKIAPEGSTAYVVFSGEEPVAAYPPQEQPYVVLLAHADLTRRVRPELKDEPKTGKPGGATAAIRKKLGRPKA